MQDASSRLLDLAKKRFSSRTLSEAEERLFLKVESGRIASFRPSEKQAARHLIKAECIEWLCTDSDARKLVTHRGIRARGARIEGVVDLDDAEIAFPIRAIDCVFSDKIRFERARLRSLALINCSVKGIQAAGVVIEGEAELNEGFYSAGEVNFVAAAITGALDFQGATLHNPAGITLYANRAKIGGSLYLRRNFRSIGEINITRITIGSNLDCGESHLINPRRQALNASSTEILGNVFLRKAFVAGAVNLLAAKVHGFIACDAGRFCHFKRNDLRLQGKASGFDGKAFIAKSAKIDGSVLLNKDFRAVGSLDFAGVEIGGNLECRSARLQEADGAILNLEQASVTSFYDNRDSWPKAGNLRLDGFTYKRIYEDPLLGRPGDRLNWIRLQPRDKFFPQSYEQLAATLKAMGHEARAREVLIEKNKAYARFLRQSFKREPGHWFRPFARMLRQEWWWYNSLGHLIAYGYKPWRAFGLSLIVIFFGIFVFDCGYDHDLIVAGRQEAYNKHTAPTNGSTDKKTLSPDYPRFNSIAYSIESFIPLLKLDQSANWMPNANSGALHPWHIPVGTTGSVLRTYLWIHIALGWILTSLWVAALAGLVKT